VADVAGTDPLPSSSFRRPQRSSPSRWKVKAANHLQRLEDGGFAFPETLTDLTTLLRLVVLVSKHIDHFTHQALSYVGANNKRIALSAAEHMRLQRAFFRYELGCRLYGMAWLAYPWGGEMKDDGFSDIFAEACAWNAFPESELEELACVTRYAFRPIEQAQRRFEKEHDIPLHGQDIVGLGLGRNYSPFLSMLGLEFLRTLQKQLADKSCRDNIIETTRPLFTYDMAMFSVDGEWLWGEEDICRPEPRLCWVPKESDDSGYGALWVCHGPRLYSWITTRNAGKRMEIKAHHQRLRDFGWVIWDEERVASMRMWGEDDIRKRLEFKCRFDVDEDDAPGLYEYLETLPGGTRAELERSLCALRRMVEESSTTISRS